MKDRNPPLGSFDPERPPRPRPKAFDPFDGRRPTAREAAQRVAELVAASERDKAALVKAQDDEEKSATAAADCLHALLTAGILKRNAAYVTAQGVLSVAGPDDRHVAFVLVPMHGTE